MLTHLGASKTLNLRGTHGTQAGFFLAVAFMAVHQSISAAFNLNYNRLTAVMRYLKIPRQHSQLSEEHWVHLRQDQTCCIFQPPRSECESFDSRMNLLQVGVKDKSQMERFGLCCPTSNDALAFRRLPLLVCSLAC